jgi:hypothetical protein
MTAVFRKSKDGATPPLSYPSFKSAAISGRNFSGGQRRAGFQASNRMNGLYRVYNKKAKAGMTKGPRTIRIMLDATIHGDEGGGWQ